MTDNKSISDLLSELYNAGRTGTNERPIEQEILTRFEALTERLTEIRGELKETGEILAINRRAVHELNDSLNEGNAKIEGLRKALDDIIAEQPHPTSGYGKVVVEIAREALKVYL